MPHYTIILATSMLVAASAYAVTPTTDINSDYYEYDARFQDAPAQALVESVPFVTGGIGKAEREQLEASRKDYNMEVKSALKSGHFTGDVRVVIKDSKGIAVLDALTDGPLFFAKLEPGNYSVEASYGSQTQKQSITIARNVAMREVMLRWDGDEPVTKLPGEQE